MVVKSLKDLKLALQNIPDDELENFGVQVDPEEKGVHLMCWDTDNDPVEKYSEIGSKYPIIFEIDSWIKAIVDQSENFDVDGVYEDMISSEDYGKDKKSSPIHKINEGVKLIR